MIQRERLTATLEGNFVVFLIGMRINKPLLIHRWLPVARAMPRMLNELGRQPDLGFMHAEMWFSRTTILVQYWRSMEQLLDYANNKEAEHLPAWRSFNQSIGTDGSVGIWHETYEVTAGHHESVYVNMPPFGLGKAAFCSRQPVADCLRLVGCAVDTLRPDPLFIRMPGGRRKSEGR